MFHCSGEDDFTKEWQAVFGATPLAGPGSNFTPVESDQPQNPADFMPSNLLASRLGGMSLGAQGSENVTSRKSIRNKSLETCIKGTV